MDERENGAEIEIVEDAADAAPGTGLARGIAVIRDALRSLPPGPGVYRMLNERAMRSMSARRAI